MLALLVAPTAFAQEYAAGYEALRVQDGARGRPVHVDVWYPAQGREEPHAYGLGVGSIAAEASLAATQLSLVLLSHGAMGAASNYSWIAEHLARRGYVVLGVSHYGQSPVFGASSVDPAAASRFDDRIRDLEFALEFFIERSNYASDLDPAVGPGFTNESLQAIEAPTLIVGSTDNDFLPYDAHARRIAELIPNGRAIELNGGEGHFVYLNECELPIEAMGVPLCVDRQTVDRASVHRNLAREIEGFLAEHLASTTAGALGQQQ